MATKTKITKTAIDALQPGAQDTWINDSELTGFAVRCQPGGKKTYVLRYRTKGGVQRKQVICPTNVTTPDKAREMARKVLAQVAEGRDPMAERKPVVQAKRPTVEDLFKAYCAHLGERGTESAREVQRCLLEAKNNAADGLGRTKDVAEITTTMVADYIGTIYHTGSRGAADKHRSYIGSAFTWAIKSANDYRVKERRDWGITASPVRDVPKDNDATNRRERNLDADELKALWQATRPGSEGFSLEVAACIRILIACGQRVQETLRIEGSEIDLDAKLWRMPKAKTKTKARSHEIPLPECILGDLALLKGVYGDGPLFPARSGSKQDLVCHRSVMQALDRWMTEANVPEFQTRDLRRTWKSRTHDAGIDRFTRDLLQQHVSGNEVASKHYDQAVYLPQMREAMNKWNLWIQQNLEDKPVLSAVA